MKQAPIDFQNRLSRLFNDRVRIRWSNHRREWHIEYKVSRGQMNVGFFVSTYDDTAIRLKDGYNFLMAIREGDRMPCPHCGYTVKVPMFEVKQLSCPYCQMKGKRGLYTAGHFPLEGDSLIQHLSKLDPLRGWRDGLHSAADKANELAMKQKERDFENHVEAVAKDHFNKLVGIPQVGYSGKEFK